MKNEVKKINIYIKYRNYRPIHQNFQELVKNPPSSVSYSIQPLNSKITKFYKIHRRFGQLLIVRKAYSIFKSFLFKEGDENNANYDLVHIVDMIPANYDSYKYVIDIGHITSLSGFYSIRSKAARDILEFLTHDNCKAILARSSASKRSISEFLDEFTHSKNKELIMGKTHVVYPATRPHSIREKQKKDEGLKLLHVGNGVFNKGVHETIEAYLNVKKSHPNTTLTVVASDYKNLPDKYLKTDVKFIEGGYSRDDIINNVFAKHDLFILPTHHEIFGMVFLDAFSVGVPAISIKQYSTPEIIEDGVNGFLIDSDRTPFEKGFNIDKEDVKVNQFYSPETKVVKGLEKQILRILANPAKLQELARNSHALTLDGKFSIKSRNSSLEKIYEKALH